jgi:hypothetical protein
MNAPNRLLATSIMLLAAVCGAMSIGLFALAPAGSLRVFQAQWPVAGVLCWDAFLSLLFFLQHSGMVRRGFRLFCRIPNWRDLFFSEIPCSLGLCFVKPMYRGRSAVRISHVPFVVARCLLVQAHR